VLTAEDILEAIHAAQGTIVLDGDDLLLRFPAPPPPDLVEVARRYKHLIVRSLRGAAGNASDERLPPLSDAMVRLLDALHRERCMVDVLPDGMTFGADCPTCGRAAALDIVEDEGGTPHVTARCDCLDPLWALDYAEVLSLTTYRQAKAAAQGQKPARANADSAQFRARKLGAEQQTFDWKPATGTGYDVP